MTTVHMDLRRPDGTPVNGWVVWLPTRRRQVDDHFVLPAPIMVCLEDGVADVEVDATTDGTWAWCVAENIPYGTRRCVLVPEQPDPIGYEDLIEVDPDDPEAEPDQMWWEALEALTARVTALEEENAAQQQQIDALEGRSSQLFIARWNGTGYDVPAEPPVGVIVRQFYGPQPYQGEPWPNVLDVYTVTEG